MSSGDRHVDSPVSEAVVKFIIREIFFRFLEVGLKCVSENFPTLGYLSNGNPPPA